MSACVDYSFPGVAKPCLNGVMGIDEYHEVHGEDVQPLGCIGKKCCWAFCCNLVWRDSKLGATTAPLCGRMPT